MEFALSEQQKMMQESIDGALAKACPLDRVRQAADRGESCAEDVWRMLAGLGVAGVLIGEEHGGLGLGLLEAALISEALGKHVAPVPFVATAVMAPLALTAAGSSAQQKRWLPKLASGEVRAAVAASEYAGGARENAGVTADGGRLSGKALFAIDVGGAGIFIVADRDRRLHLVEANAKGLATRALPTIDRTRALGELVFDGVAAEPLAGARAVNRRQRARERRRDGRRRKALRKGLVRDRCRRRRHLHRRRSRSPAAPCRGECKGPRHARAADD
jgi:alkylation response protein AidB-like acyl-CoA dehydrogenase